MMRTHGPKLLAKDGSAIDSNDCRCSCDMTDVAQAKKCRIGGWPLKPVT